MSESLYCRTCATLVRTPHRLTLLSRLLTFFGILLIVGMLPWLSGSDPALALLRARSGEQEATAVTLTAIRQSLGLDRGPLSLFGHWLWQLLQGDAGVSWVSGRPVLPGMLQAAGVSLTLMAAAALVAALLAAALCLPVLWRGLHGKPRVSSGIAAATLTTLPEFLLATVLLIVGAVWLRWLPPYGWQGVQHVILPALALGIPAGGYLGRIFADALSESLNEKWLLTWSVAGIARRHLLLALLTRALPGVLPLLSLVLVSMTGGAIAVEKVFAIPGIGRATLGAAAAQDLPALQAGVLIMLLLAAVAGLLTSALRQLLLGRALRGGAMPTPAINRTPSSHGAIWLTALCLALFCLLLLAGLTRDPYLSGFTRLQPPSLALPFGADAMGRDLLARVAHGTLHTCVMAFVAALICLLIGLLAGFFPRFCSGPIEAANALPPVMAGLIVAALTGPSAGGAVLAVIVVSWAPLAAHTAALLSEARARAWVQMLPILGVGPLRAGLCYLLPAVAGPLFRHAMLRVPGIALALASLGFLGLGAAPPLPEWGRLLAEGMPYVERACWVVLAPGGALIVLSLLAIAAGRLR
ncbi:Binding-protein-dependent transport system inner membrane component [Duffyella gerundensis]|uniref:ABC transporter permease subunit n=1 Tax=Duffyella gerundensis TaxID=1619313 RepID=UPI001CE28AC3|nr:ABC transporter permease subunit [Duffyella gerundensis]UCB31076.1 Binding-protein-dependent transport system inner membrane component [Duffyella gerundensis]